MVSQHGPVVSRCGHDQDQAIDPTVAQLRLAAPLQGLDVSKPGLSVHADRSWPVELRIPCTQIPEITDGHLAAPSEALTQLGSEPSQQAQLAGIAHRLSPWVHLDAEPQSEHSGVYGQVIEASGRTLCVLRPAHLGLAETSSLGHVPLAEPGSQPGFAQLLTEPAQDLGCMPVAPGASSLHD